MPKHNIKRKVDVIMLESDKSVYITDKHPNVSDTGHGNIERNKDIHDIYLIKIGFACILTYLFPYYQDESSSHQRGHNIYINQQEVNNLKQKFLYGFFYPCMPSIVNQCVFLALKKSSREHSKPMSSDSNNDFDQPNQMHDSCITTTCKTLK